MKKLICLLTGVILFASAGAQTVDQVIKKYSAAIKADQLARVKTLKITGKATMMGMEMPIEMYMKNPDKIKAVYNFSGQQMITVFDGQKGYMLNPLTGSSEPIELKGEQLNQLTRNNILSNELLNNYKKKKLTYEGEESVNGKPAYKLNFTMEGNIPVSFFIDKSSGLMVKMSAAVDQKGTTMNVETYPSDYTEKNGLVIPMKTTAMINGMEAGVIKFDNVEVNIPVDDSVFKVK